MKTARGFTLVESMIAAAVFGIGLSGLVALQSITASSSALAGRMGIATHIATSKIERWRSLGRPQLMALLADPPQTTYDRRGRPMSDPNHTAAFFTLTPQLNAGTGVRVNWLDVTVTCSWAEGTASTPHHIALGGRIVMP